MERLQDVDGTILCSAITSVCASQGSVCDWWQGHLEADHHQWLTRGSLCGWDSAPGPGLPAHWQIWRGWVNTPSLMASVNLTAALQYYMQILNALGVFCPPFFFFLSLTLITCMLCIHAHSSVLVFYLDLIIYVLVQTCFEWLFCQTLNKDYCSSLFFDVWLKGHESAS